MSPVDLAVLGVAYDLARQNALSGFLPIGAILLSEKRVLASGVNERVQKNDPTAHAEMVCFRNAGRLSPAEFRSSVLYTTLSPCDMCAGAILLNKIPLVIIGENRNFKGPEKYLESRGVKLVRAQDKNCIAMMKEFIENNSKLWNEDIGEIKTPC
ncbi:MAG: cytosine deaminase [Parcubacteria group bacterium Gr01-1014_19]|nr:MAG: cytosine deaminase [Parcubacteria group bacterium Gr01-1014_19]